jgi:heme/copper-type cytochrome/quinol oxidase subunit 2
MALGRFVSGLAIAAMVATTPVSAQTVAAAPQPQAEEFSDESALQGSNIVFGGVVVALVIAVLLIVVFRDEEEDVTLPPPVSP